MTNVDFPVSVVANKGITMLKWKPSLDMRALVLFIVEAVKGDDEEGALFQILMDQMLASDVDGGMLVTLIRACAAQYEKRSPQRDVMRWSCAALFRLPIPSNNWDVVAMQWLVV